MTRYIETEYQQHKRVWFVTHADFETVEWPMTPEDAAVLLPPPRVLGRDDSGARTWSFDWPPRFEADVIDYATELWTQDEHHRAEPLLRAVLKANSRQIDALMRLGCLVEQLGRDAEAAALLAEAVYQARSAIPDDFNWQRDQIPWGHIPNRAIHRAW